MNKINWVLTAVIVTLLVGLFLTSCQTQSKTAAIQVEEVWGRTSPSSVSIGVFYLQIINSGGQADKLISAQSNACSVIELHETIQDGDTMGMRPVEGGIVEIPANGTVEFKSGGLHLMCIDKQDDFSVGAVIPLILQFENTGAVEVQAEIRNP